MSRYYGMSIDITGHAPDRVRAIQKAAEGEWDGFDNNDDWSKDNHTLSAYAEGSLCGGESEDDFSTRLTHAIWTANGAFCKVTVTATYLEDLPCEIHTLSSEDYDSFIATARSAPSPR